ncbi:hypothetical protein CDAR_456581 [Caerostris darwini]|uniref:Uncharacterized protein n=1 Tax=Caerostris darwini TaxID=1538125 RepID=A0AAV4T8H1_9ARAC|nr:hypothetical protein CDAR_456581 [Caerostris darwini]
MHPFSDCFFCLYTIPNSLHFSHNPYIIQEVQSFCHGLLQYGKHPLARTQSTHGNDPKESKVTFSPSQQIEKKIECQKVVLLEASSHRIPLRGCWSSVFPISRGHRHVILSSFLSYKEIEFLRSPLTKGGKNLFFEYGIWLIVEIDWINIEVERVLVGRQTMVKINLYVEV